VSADNWAICPRCVARWHTEVETEQARVDDLYGLVPVAEFDEARLALQAKKATTHEPTFREDYEIYGAEDGEVVATYSGGCAACGLRLEFRHAHPLDVDGES
jgi:hypothetical protein